MQELLKEIAFKKELLHGITLTILIFGRLVFAVFFTPFFGGGRQIPGRIKMATAGALTAVLYPALAKSLPGPVPTDIFELAGLFMKEAFVGLLLGMSVSMVFYGIQGAGQFIDNQRGLSHAAIFNPALGAQSSQTAQFLFQLSVVIFFIIGGHRIYITALFHSFEVLPLIVYPHIHPEFNDPAFQVLTKVAAGVLVTAIQLAAPVVISMFLCEVVLGVANRVAPQMDVQFISYTLKAIVGLLIIFLCLHLIVWQIHKLLEQDFIQLKQLIEALPGV